MYIMEKSRENPITIEYGTPLFTKKISHMFVGISGCFPQREGKN